MVRYILNIYLHEWSTRKSCGTKGDLSTWPISVVAAVVVNLFARLAARCFCSIFPSCYNHWTFGRCQNGSRKSPGTELIMFKTANPRQNLVESTDKYWNLQLFLWPQQQPATFSILFPVIYCNISKRLWSYLPKGPTMVLHIRPRYIIYQ